MLRKITATIPLLFLFALNAFCQTGKITGKITDENNRSLPGVSVKIVGTQSGVASDVDGRYSLLLHTGKYTIEFTSVGFKAKLVQDIEIIEGKEIVLDVVMEEQGKNEEEVVLKAASPKKETINAMLNFQKNTNTVAQVISAESIKRSPDKNTGEVLRRVTGASILEGKYLVIRGLSERYNQALLNGVLLSTTEPDRKTFSFDIFPAQMVDNIIVNKAFVPEYPGEWAGGLIQVNTKDIPGYNFLKLDIGTNFNTNTVGKDFFSYPGGKLDWLGFDDGTRGLPADFPTKTVFAGLTPAEKIKLGESIATNNWGVNDKSGLLNTLGQSFQLSGGFRAKLFKKDLGGIIAITYNRGARKLDYNNKFFTINGLNADDNFDFYNEKYSQKVLWGALGNFAVRLNNNNKISFRNLININASDYTTLRTGKDYESNSQLGENIRARELGFRSTIFFNTILSGDHNIVPIGTKLHWYGSFNILDNYVPMQRRIQYNQDPTNANAPYLALISNTLSQKAGSIFYSYLNDYIYTAGGDLTKRFKLFSRQQEIKGGYLLQIKDRLYDSRPFAINLPTDNPTLRAMDEGHIFSPENFGTADNMFGFTEMVGNQYRYMANTILNAGYLQFDNRFNNWLRVVWGVRYENFDQLVGSPRKSDPRFVYSKVGDFLPSLNLTFKTNQKTNIRLSASQTLVRPEFRELSNLAFYDFEIGATITGNKNLVRTKITNLDVRYEIYPRAGEIFTLGGFYKYFNSPIELQFNQSGAGSSNTFNYVNANSAKSVGVEFEFRKKLDFINSLKNFTLQGNFSYIYNRVKFTNQVLNRPMQGQSPYLINFALQYDVEKLGINTTILYNQIGRRILYVGNNEVPAIWEAPRPLLDLQIAKKIMKNKGEIKLSVSDIINQTARFYHDLDLNKKYTSNVDALALTRKYGTNISLTFGYNFK